MLTANGVYHIINNINTTGGRNIYRFFNERYSIATKLPN